MKLSVIIPTHERTDALRRTLEALAAQTLPEDLFEVIVVDDGSGEETRAALRDLRGRFDFALIEKQQGGLASARNAGAGRAQGEILHFLDDDVVPDAATLREHVETHEAAGEAVVVVGSLPFPEQMGRDPFLWYLERSGHYDLYEDPGKYPGGRPPLPPLNGNSSLPRELFDRIGRYDEGFKQYGGEDLELGYRLARAGTRFVYNPRAVGWHYHAKSFARFCVDMERAGESLIRIYRIYPEIKVPKKIDVMVDPLTQLPFRKQLMRVVMATTLAIPGVLAVPRGVIAVCGRSYALRYLLFPFYRWVGFAHYAMGMRRELAQTS